jgi:sucrose phosphorylase
VNCSYFSALGDDEAAYLMARAIQFFAPGIPQVYYVGLLAGRNDLALLEETKVGRNINRHYYTTNEIVEDLNRKVVKQLLQLMKFRNEHPAFEGTFEMLPSRETEIYIVRTSGEHRAELFVDLLNRNMNILYTDQNSKVMKTLQFV